MGLKTYIINLEKSSVRKQYMQELLSKYSFLDIEFLKAIDGRLLSDEERRSRFDFAKSVKIYGKDINAGEVGCALSHRKAYSELLKSQAQYALVLEDDISIIRDLDSLDLSGVDKTLTSRKPRVLMLSGDYWFYRKKSIARLFTATGAYAYIINRAAAKKILDIEPPCCLADDWTFYKRKGLKLYAVNPYLVDANMKMDLLSSDVMQDSWTIDRFRMSKKEVVVGYAVGLLKRLFKAFHHFESKVRIIDNVIVDNE